MAEQIRAGGEGKARAHVHDTKLLNVSGVNLSSSETSANVQLHSLSPRRPS